MDRVGSLILPRQRQRQRQQRRPDFDRKLARCPPSIGPCIYVRSATSNCSWKIPWLRCGWPVTRIPVLIVSRCTEGLQSRYHRRSPASGTAGPHRRDWFCWPCWCPEPSRGGLPRKPATARGPRRAVRRPSGTGRLLLLPGLKLSPVGRPAGAVGGWPTLSS